MSRFGFLTRTVPQIQRAEADTISQRVLELVRAEFPQYHIEGAAILPFGTEGFAVGIEFHTTPRGARESALWSRHCAMAGLDIEDYGRIITTIDGRQYRLVEINPRATRFQVIAVGLEDDNRYCFTAAAVHNAIAEQEN